MPATQTKEQLIDELEAMPQPTLEGVERMLCFKDLKFFIERMWRTVETRSFVDGWHIDVLCEHLEAVTAGKVKKLVINMPPRHMKSLSVSVFWPAWVWLRKPEHQWLFASYAETLSIRDSVKCRRLIQSPAYQELLQEFQPDFVLVGDQNTKIRYENSYGGYRLATSVGGALTGEGGDTIVVDDAHNVVEVESEIRRLTVLQWWDEAMSTRLNDMETGSKVVMGQRTHEEDLPGHILAEEKGWDQLIFPARYEGESRVVSTLDYEDPRTEIDEPLWLERFSNEVLVDLEKSLGMYGTAAQLQQNPSPRGGGMFKTSGFQLVDDYNPHLVMSTVRYWDKAGTEGGGCFTSGVRIHKMRDDCPYAFLISDVTRGQWSYGEREDRIKQDAELDTTSLQRPLPHNKRPKYKVWIEQEPGSGGKESAERSVKNLAGYEVFVDKVTGDKVARAQAYAIQVEAGNVGVLKRDWTEGFIKEHGMAPKGKLKDQWDSSAGGFNKLTVAVKRAGAWGRRHRSRAVVRSAR